MDKERALLLKPVRAAALLDISKSKIYDAIKRGDIPSVRIAGVLRVPLAAIEDLITQRIERGDSE